MNTNEILKNQQELADAKDKLVSALLDESTRLDADRDKRQAEIKEELKALGYKRPRAANKPKADAPVA